MIKRRDIKKEQPTEYQVCLIFPQWVKAEYLDGYFLSTTGDVMYMRVKSWIPVGELREIMED